MTQKTYQTPPGSYRVREKLRHQPIFQKLTDDYYRELYEQCEERLYPDGAVIAHAQKRREGILVITSGTAEVYAAAEDQEAGEVLEVVQEGGILGLGSLSNFLGISNEDAYAYMVEIRAVETVVGLYIPYGVLGRLWRHEDIRDYFLHQVVSRLKDVYVSLAEQVRLAHELGESDPFLLRVQDIMTKPATAVDRYVTIQEAAEKMIAEKASSIVITDHGRLEGIITEKDFVNRVVTSNKSVREHAGTIMTEHPYHIHRADYYYHALSEMILRGVKHLPVVDGKDKVVGMITMADLLRKKNRQMFSAIRKVEETEADRLNEVKTEIYDILAMLIRDNVPSLHVLDVLTQLYDRLTKRAVTIAIDSLKRKGAGEPPVPFVWYQMGSAGRGEQFVLTDQDHFLVYEDVESLRKKEVDEYFAQLGEEITNYLEIAGYERCKGKMMASELMWRGSMSKWNETLRKWAMRSTNESLLLAQNFFSFRKLYGSDGLHTAFIRMVREDLKRSSIFLYRLAQVEKENQIPSLEQPIRALLRIERKQLDLKKQVLFPFHHALQILSLSHHILEGTTVEKLQALVEKDIITDWLATDLRHALSQVMDLYIKQKWGSITAGKAPSSIVTFSQFSTRDKEKLIRALKEMRKLQTTMLSQYSL
ncbi:DUF294 nucleotidyltransferase-like domain-containing protein [Thalassobacillus devorans]|uniref:DUF294 nucleotidyltransferase-like domain-containing protein n=1 Tax=Thalassobacillus devorans TaxID=279813 RepID=UPI00048B9F25|nr:DUF294 nucleotidyltransferase-like domain-containing protein [Thalassobacillus devorans]